MPFAAIKDHVLLPFAARLGELLFPDGSPPDNITVDANENVTCTFTYVAARLPCERTS